MSKQRSQSQEQSTEQQPATEGEGQLSPAEFDAQETLGNAEMQRLLNIEPAEGFSHDYNFAGQQALGGRAAAKWESTPDMAWHFEPTGWLSVKLVIDRHHLDMQYWTASDYAWDPIAQFPGGSYISTFNTQEGAEIHEEAEMTKVGERFDALTVVAEGASGSDHATPQAAYRAFAAQYAPAKQKYLQAQQAIINHTDPVGPQSEWDFYKSVAPGNAGQGAAGAGAGNGQGAAGAGNGQGGS